jgi:hypothetical protein
VTGARHLHDDPILLGESESRKPPNCPYCVAVFPHGLAARICWACTGQLRRDYLGGSEREGSGRRKTETNLWQPFRELLTRVSWVLANTPARSLTFIRLALAGCVDKKSTLDAFPPPPSDWDIRSHILSAVSHLCSRTLVLSCHGLCRFSRIEASFSARVSVLGDPRMTPDGLQQLTTSIGVLCNLPLIPTFSSLVVCNGVSWFPLAVQSV